MSISDNLKRGTLEISVLTLLSQKDMYGYELSQELALQSNNLYTIQETSLYPLLYRMTDKGYISCKTELVGKRRTRVYYHLEDTGAKYLEAIRREYISQNRGVFYILGYKDLGELDKD